MKSVRVRMYRHGLGDCILLTFPRDCGDAHVLIDCGVMIGTEGAQERIQRVAQSIFETTRGRLDALVVTNQQWDHVSGFLQAQSVFNQLQIREVWLAWTEDPADALARDLSNRRSKSMSAVCEAAMRLIATSDHHANQTASQIENLLGFQGELGVGGRQTTAEAMKWIKTRTGARVRYLTPGATPIESSALENVRVYVLGPPRDLKMLRKSTESASANDVYGLSGVDGASLGFAASAGSAGEDSPDRDEHDAQPFDKWFRMSDLEVWDDPFFDEYYGGGVHDEDDQSWRRIESEWLGAAGRLAFQLDSHINRMSLALAFELLPFGRVLLFPGDAEVGSWLSWERNWRPPNAAAPLGITIPDLLARTVLYKVGHHGRQNGTLRDVGLDLMSSGELTAMLSVDRKMAKKMNWQMPFPALYRRLLEKTNGRILDSELGISQTQTEHANEPEWRDFLARTEVRPEWIDYRIRT